VTPDTTYDQLLEATLRAERALLGAVLVAPDRLTDAQDAVAAQDFFRAAHGLLWATIGRLAAQGRAIDLVTLCAALTPEQLQEVGGPAYIAGLLDGVPRSSNAAHYAHLVHDAGLRRRIEQTARQVLQQCQAGEAEAPEVLAGLEQALVALRQGLPSTGLIDPATRAHQAIAALEAARAGQTQGTPTGISPLDAWTRGLRPGQLVVLGARPSMGKSSLALSLAVAAGTVGPVLFASLEMSAEELNLRELAWRTQLPHRDLELEALEPYRAPRVQAGLAGVEAGQIFLLDLPGATVGQVRAAARRLKAQQGRLALVVVDYLQLLRPEPGQRSENRTLEVSQQSAALKQLARELGVPVLALSQLSRASEARQDKRPLLSDLRESGAIEQDADVVLLLHRPGYYTPDPTDTRAELIVAKQRNGPTGPVWLQFDPDTMRFTDAPAFAAYA
jgi:replicative DNA helicase